MLEVITVIVIDDHEIVRSGVIECLSLEPGFAVLGQGRSADDAVRLARDLRPRLALLDVNMPGGGIEAARLIAVRVPETAVVMFSFREDPSVQAKATEAGAAGYLVKGISGAELADALRRAVGPRS